MTEDLHRCIGLYISLNCVTPKENVIEQLCLGVLPERGREGFTGQISTEH